MIRLEELTKVYDLPSGKEASLTAVDRLQLEIAAGGIFGLVGPNGAGKTSTIRMLCGLLRPTAGRAVVHGVDVQRDPEEAQRYIGYLSDFFTLYDDLKVWEYLDYFARAYKIPADGVPARVEETLRIIRLEEKRDAMIAGLSRGMKQRVGIGRAIIHNPEVLILDEPTAGLDPKARSDLKDLLRQLQREGKTILITSHILADLEEICTELAIMQDGHIVRSGALEQVMRDISGGRRIRIRLAAAGFDLAAGLAGRPGVTNLLPESKGAVFAFSGTDAEIAELVGALVGSGAPVCGVETVTESLEKLYARITPGDAQ